MPVHVINQTPFPHFAFRKLGYRGEHWFTVVVRVTCDIDPVTGQCSFSDEQQPVIMADRYRNNPENSSLLTETDLIFRKPRGEFYITGTAYTTDNIPQPQWIAGFTFGQLQKQLTLSGPRFWSYHQGWKADAPAAVTALPLIYENAYGGHDISGAYPANPVGTGWFSADNADKSARYPLPRITLPGSESVPPVFGMPWPVAGFGLYSRWWSPRLQYAGTYDHDWLENTRPYYPADFKPDFFMGAPADQQQEGYFTGNETLTIRGMFPEVAEASFRLPEIGFFAVQDIPGEPLVPDDCVLDTVHLSLDELKLCLTWRYSLTDILPGIPLQIHAYKLS